MEKLTVYQRTAYKLRADALAYEIIGDKKKARQLREESKLFDSLHIIHKEHYRDRNSN